MNILETIVDHKRDEIASRKRDVSASGLRDMEFYRRSTHSLKKSLDRQPKFGIIAEIKRSSPSGGEMKSEFRPVDIAAQYERNGAAGISVLTDGRFFNGNINDLREVRRTAGIPLLRKEFIIDEFQITEAKAYGADAVLLIAGILDKSQLLDYIIMAKELSLESLVELYDESEVKKIDFDVVDLLGINNRNLRTLEIDLNRTFQMAKHIPNGITIVSESGIRSAEDLKRLSGNGIKAALIGEQFMKSGNPGDELCKMLEGIEQ